MTTAIAPNKNLVSVCGLFCPACGIYYSTQENNEANLKKIAQRMNINIEEVRCNGCRTDVNTAFCRDCLIIKCADTKGIDFCIECSEYPCVELKEFQSKMPHRVELWKSLESIKNIGWEAWFQEMVHYYSCSKCDTVNGWYDINCKNCGTFPGSSYVKNNIEILKSKTE